MSGRRLASSKRRTRYASRRASRHLLGQTELTVGTVYTRGGREGVRAVYAQSLVRSRTYCTSEERAGRTKAMVSTASRTGIPVA
jgi:hypothetical protein